MDKATEIQVERLLRTGSKIEDIQRMLSLPEAEIRAIAITRVNRWVLSPDRRGREELRPYIIAIKHVDGIWPRPPHADGLKIRAAHHDYDAGRIEIAQARDGNNIILYALPRQTLAKRTHRYFTAGLFEQ